MFAAREGRKPILPSAHWARYPASGNLHEPTHHIIALAVIVPALMTYFGSMEDTVAPSGSQSPNPVPTTPAR